MGAVYYIGSQPDYVTEKQFKSAHALLNAKIDSLQNEVAFLRLDTDTLKNFAAAQALNTDTLKAGQVVIYNRIAKPGEPTFFEKLKYILK